MPRLPHSLLLRARSISPLLPLLLRTCRTLFSARNELRWLVEHALSITGEDIERPEKARSLLLQLCLKRSRGVPLQYLLGSQPFGELDILCRPGVLIPRPETEAYTSHISELLLQDPVLASKGGLKILDICSGTGCISLLLYALLSRKQPKTQVLGVDLSDRALMLARENVKHNAVKGHLSQQALNQVSFVQADVLSPSFRPLELSVDHLEWDIVISNPPYISETGFNKDTNRSVRNWEPKLALVPPSVQYRDFTHSHAEDIFYYKILDTARAGSARVVLMEVGDLQQALRVAQVALNTGLWNLVEIWRDWPDQQPEIPNKVEDVVIGEHRIRIRGTGKGRSVLCRRGQDGGKLGL